MIRILVAILLAVLVLGALSWVLFRLAPKHGQPRGPTTTFVPTTG